MSEDDILANRLGQAKQLFKLVILSGKPILCGANLQTQRHCVTVVSRHTGFIRTLAVHIV